MRTQRELGTRYEIRSVVRALEVLKALAHADGGTEDLSTIAAATDLHTSTTFRLLDTLASHGFVESVNGGYRIGPRAFEVGSAFLRGTSVWTHAPELSRQLASETNETASVGILDNGRVLYIAIAHGQSELGIQSFPGTHHPAHCTALGKAMLAAMPWPRAENVLQGTDLVRLTPRTHASLDELRIELAKVAEQGYAVDDEERSTGVRCVGAAILDHAGTLAAVSVSGPTFRMQGAEFDAARDKVVAAAQAATLRLGGVWATVPPW